MATTTANWLTGRATDWLPDCLSVRLTLCTLVCLPVRPSVCMSCIRLAGEFNLQQRRKIDVKGVTGRIH